MDYRKYFYGKGITVVEWADKIMELVPESAVRVRIEDRGVSDREIQVRGTRGDDDF